MQVLHNIDDFPKKSKDKFPINQTDRDIKLKDNNLIKKIEVNISKEKTIVK